MEFHSMCHLMIKIFIMPFVAPYIYILNLHHYIYNKQLFDIYFDRWILRFDINQLSQLEIPWVFPLWLEYILIVISITLNNKTQKSINYNYRFFSFCSIVFPNYMNICQVICCQIYIITIFWSKKARDLWFVAFCSIFKI